MVEDSPSRPTLAVFDLDGTLTTRDTSLPFILFAVGRSRLVGSMVAALPFLLVDMMVTLKREVRAEDHHKGSVRGRWEVEVHQRLLRATFKGMEREAFLELGRRFASEAMDAMVSPGRLSEGAGVADGGRRPGPSPRGLRRRAVLGRGQATTPS